MKFTKKIILFVLSLKIEVFQDYDFLYNCLVLPKSTIRSAILELVSDGLVEKISRNKKPFFRITSLGKKQLFCFLPAFSKPPSWDKKWRLVVVLGSVKPYRTFLEKKGFVKLQSGVYVGLENISKELIVKGWGRAVFITSFIKSELYDNKELASKLWNLENIRKCCLEIIDQADGLLKRIKKRKRELRQLRFDCFVILKSAFNLIQRMPALPKQLLPHDWPVEELKKTIGQLCDPTPPR